jgi:cytochrome oxidase assembly protein ShyY1
MRTRVKQVLVVLVGLALAAVMLSLGLWQMRVFEDQGNRSAAERARQPVTQLLDHVAADGTVGDIYGKQVRVSGRYLADQQVLVVDARGATRVLAAFEVAGGRVLPIVRGSLANAASPIPSPPAGELTQEGIFLPSEPGADHLVPDDQLGTVRLPLLAQRWPQQLVPGFVTLKEPESLAQQLAPVTVVLPSGDGSWRNGGYALQWWVFAAFALGMSLKVAQSLGRGETAPGRVGS